MSIASAKPGSRFPLAQKISGPTGLTDCRRSCAEHIGWIRTQSGECDMTLAQFKRRSISSGARLTRFTSSTAATDRYRENIRASGKASTASSYPIRVSGGYAQTIQPARSTLAKLVAREAGRFFEAEFRRQSLDDITQQVGGAIKVCCATNTRGRRWRFNGLTLRIVSTIAAKWPRLLVMQSLCCCGAIMIRLENSRL